MYLVPTPAGLVLDSSLTESPPTFMGRLPTSMGRTQGERGFTGFQVPLTPTDRHTSISQVVSGLHTPSLDLMINTFLAL